MRLRKRARRARGAGYLNTSSVHDRVSARPPQRRRARPRRDRLGRNYSSTAVSVVHRERVESGVRGTMPRRINASRQVNPQRSPSRGSTALQASPRASTMEEARGWGKSFATGMSCIYPAAWRRGGSCKSFSSPGALPKACLRERREHRDRRSRRSWPFRAACDAESMKQGERRPERRL